MTGPIMRMFQTTTHAFNRQPIGPAKRKGQSQRGDEGYDSFWGIGTYFWIDHT